ncbi:unnamed protein product, partial [marine sediment metagenome]
AYHQYGDYSSTRQRFPKTFLNAYPENETKVITQENYLEFISY